MSTVRIQVRRGTSTDWSTVNPTLAAGETWKDLAKDSFDAESAGKRGYGYEILDQLAMEHLMGVTG